MAPPKIFPVSTLPGPHTVEVANPDARPGETAPRRHPSAQHGLATRPHPSVGTVFDVLEHAAQKYADRNAAGYRSVVQVHSETKQVTNAQGQTVPKSWSFYELSPYHFMTYAQLQAAVAEIGSALVHLGLHAHDRVEIFAPTSLFWFASAHGAISQSLTVVTAYESLGADGLKHSLAETDARAVFVDASLLPTLADALSPAVQFVCYHSQADSSQYRQQIDAFAARHPATSLLSFADLRALGRQHPAPPTPPAPTDLACIMYTSGSTGPPKGVQLQHKTIVAAMAGIDVLIGPHIVPGDGLIAYLPLAHIIEFVFENIALYWGGTLGYASPRTLTDASVRNCRGDMREFQPSIMVGVPAVWELVKKGIVARVDAGGALLRGLFWGALSLKQAALAWGLTAPAALLDAAVFDKVRAATGGKLRLMMNGGGPIAKDTQAFLSMVIAPLLVGYGLTETAGMGAFNDPRAWTTLALGTIPPSVEVKLVDVPDLGYSTASTPPQGEIWIRGDAVTEGYYRLPQANAEAFDHGWFKTGDIGEFDALGQLRLIDRKKNLVKTLNGEYIALEKLESVYQTHALVRHICVYAAADQAKPVALVSPAEPALRDLAARAGASASSSSSLEALCADRAVVQAALRELVGVGRRSGLAPLELIQGLVLTPMEWTPQNNLLTSTPKLNRRVVVETFKREIAEAYK